MKKLTNYVAHVKQKMNSSDWDVPHNLAEHLIKTAELAGQFAPKNSIEWASLTGQWHDLGKYRKRFQDYIRYQSGFERENAHIENSQRAPHSTAGAIHAVSSLPPIVGHIVAYMIAGHHAGLPDWEGGRGSLKYRLKDGEQEYQEALQEAIPDDILQFSAPQFPSFIQNKDVLPLWIRILFSCLVDADFRDTESYMAPEKTKQRGSYPDLNDLLIRFDKEISKLRENAPDTPLIKIRNEILAACNKAAVLKPGLFSLTVPTGGGKTLSSLSFALRHAKKFNKRRIIYAIPFTSIIEQNAEVFRQFLGDESVLEHHSSLDVDPGEENSKARLATENWDAPLIVTTNVQLFESLFASRTSRCRKLHNLVDSIIILDEAQQIPREFQAPITQVMQQMSDHFGVTWVLCTATQPDLSAAQDYLGRTTFNGLNNIREIVSDPTQLAQQLKRVEVVLPKHDAPITPWPEVAEQLSQEDSVLAIVNTRKNAKDLYGQLPNDGNNLHLSANMCAEHRTNVIQQIKHRLAARRAGDTRPLRVVSTSLIEAGVDVDFPVVYRAIAGLDSIAQSAGRCNREGKLESGRVIVFKPEQPSPPGFLRDGESATLEMIGAGLLDDPLSPSSFLRYFKALNNKADRDRHKILSEFLKVKVTQKNELAIQFRSAAEKFRLIDDKGVSVIVPFQPKEGSTCPVETWIEQLERDPLEKWIYKKLQRYTVSLPERIAHELVKIGAIEQRAGLKVLMSKYYDSVWGVYGPDDLLDGVI
jgi:CRISPR-associated endonuclease/helicase Cas3